MSFNSWAKQIILSTIESDGQVVYNKDGWFCATNTGFLFRVQFEKIRFGNFRVQCNIMPLVAPLNEDDMGVYMNMAVPFDAGFDYFAIEGYPLFERPEFRTKTYDAPETEEACIAIIRNYLNPLFRQMDSLEHYCIHTIRLSCEPRCGYHTPLQWREAIAKELFFQGYSEKYEPPEWRKDIADPDYPWYTSRINGVPFVFAALGKYKESLAYINHHDYFRWIKPAVALKQAMLNNDVEECNSVLDRIYAKNREAIENTLGLKIPESWR